MEPSTKPAEKPDWRARAACRERGQEMVPDDPQGVLLAKKVCADCPVTSRCFAYAEQLTKTFGRWYAQGVWGGLTLRERDVLAALDRPVTTCPSCGLACVIVSHATDRCIGCDPENSLRYLDYQDRITSLIAAGQTYQQVADVLRVEKSTVTGACYGWGIRAKTASKRGRRALKECGTLAAKERHRKHGESWENCACRHVPWKKGKARSKTRQEVNAN